MAVLTVRNVPDEVHRALRARASAHGRSTEAEVRAILATAVDPARRFQLGEALFLAGRELGLSDHDIASINAVRDRAPAEPPTLP